MVLVGEGIFLTVLTDLVSLRICTAQVFLSKKRKRPKENAVIARRPSVPIKIAPEGGASTANGGTSSNSASPRADGNGAALADGADGVVSRMGECEGFSSLPLSPSSFFLGFLASQSFCSEGVLWNVFLFDICASQLVSVAS